MAKVFLIIGNTGAGKSTYAKKLAEIENAYIFTGDEWFRTLFVPDTPTPSSYEWALERTKRIETQILTESLKLLSKNLNVILDIGFFSQQQRQRVQQFFTQHHYLCITHFLDVNKATRWERVVQRNTEKTNTFQFEVSKEIFEFCETIFEPLDAQESNDAVIFTL